MRISDWSSDVCSSDLASPTRVLRGRIRLQGEAGVHDDLSLVLAEGDQLLHRAGPDLHPAISTGQAGDHPEPSDPALQLEIGAVQLTGGMCSRAGQEAGDLFESTLAPSVGAGVPASREE